MSDNQRGQPSKQYSERRNTQSFLRRALSNDSNLGSEQTTGSPSLDTAQQRYRSPGSQALGDDSSTQNKHVQDRTNPKDLSTQEVSFEENKNKYDHLKLEKADETGVLDYFVGGKKNQREVERLFDPKQKKVVADSQRAPKEVQNYKDYHIEKAIKEYIEVERENTPEQIIDIEKRTQEIFEEEYGVPNKPIDTVVSTKRSEEKKEQVPVSEDDKERKSTDLIEQLTNQEKKQYEEQKVETIKAQNTQEDLQSALDRETTSAPTQTSSTHGSNQTNTEEQKQKDREQKVNRARKRLKAKLAELGSHSSYSSGSVPTRSSSSRQSSRRSPQPTSTSQSQAQQAPASSNQGYRPHKSSRRQAETEQASEQQQEQEQETKALEASEKQQEQTLKEKLDEVKKAKETVDKVKSAQQGAKAAEGAKAAQAARGAGAAAQGGAAGGGAAALAANPWFWVVVIVLIILLIICLIIIIIIAIIASANPTITKENLQNQGKGLVTFMGVGEVDAEPFRRENLRSGLDDAVLVDKDSAGNVNAVTFQTGYRLNKNYRDDVIDLPLDEMKLQIQVLEGIPAATDFTIDFEYGGEGAAISQAGKGMLWTLVCRNNGCDEDTSVVTINFQEPVAPEEIGQIFRVTYDMQANFNIGGAIRDQVKSDLPTRELCINIVSGEQVYCSGFSNPFFGEDYADNAGQEISGGEVVNNGDIVDGYMCPFVTSFESGEGRLVCTQGRHGAYGAVDLAYSGANRWYDQTEVLSPVDGRVIYAEHAGNVPLCGDALLIVDDTTGVQYYIGHIALNAQMNQNVNNSSIRGGRGTGFTVKQGEKLGTVFMTDEFNPSYGNNFVEGGMAGQLCWLGAHLHMDKRNDEAGTTVFDNIEKSCKLQGKVTNADRCR